MKARTHPACLISIPAPHASEAVAVGVHACGSTPCHKLLAARVACMTGTAGSLCTQQGADLLEVLQADVHAADLGVAHAIVAQLPRRHQAGLRVLVVRQLVHQAVQQRLRSVKKDDHSLQSAARRHGHGAFACTVQGACVAAQPFIREGHASPFQHDQLLFMQYACARQLPWLGQPHPEGSVGGSTESGI